MNPTFLDNMSWEMAEVYGAVSDQILINLAHYFPWYDESKLPRSTFAYMSDMLAQMGKVSRDAVNIIHRNLDGADEALRGILEQAIIDSIRATNPPLLDAAKKGILQPAGVPIVAPNQMRAYSLYYKQAADKLNLVNTVMLESTQQAYAATVADVVARVQATQTALDIGAGESITGVSSWNQATQHAIRRMADRGITGFIDHAGHRWSAEAYVAMDIRTTVANTARSAVWETNKNFGNDLYSVSYHNGARPLCYPWQNKVISATDQARTVTDLDGNEITVYAQSDTTYGQAAGLFGINCKHYPTPFIPGVSLIRGQPQDEKANEIAYEQSQEQRRLERKLREDRRDLMMMKARGVPEEQIKAQQAKCEQSSQDIQDFCDSTGRARRRNREGVYTKRSFPAADTYDVTAFERTQQEQLAEFFANGGAQTGYTFGQNTQAAPKAIPATLQMYDDALQWAEDIHNDNIQNVREAWQNNPAQLKAIDEYEKNLPYYESTIKKAVEREEFSTRTTSEAVVKILEDGRFKSQIETGTSNGFLDVDYRKRATMQLFAGGEQIPVGDAEYEIYGYLDKAPRANMYGDSRIVFKKENLIDRTTLTVGDSLELLARGGDPMATLATDPKMLSYGEVFGTSVANAPEWVQTIGKDIESIKKSGHMANGNYIELQFHGGVTVGDIEYIQLSKRDAFAQRIAELAQTKGVKIKWLK